jgi:UDP-N-acetylglucosamine:LPS N-acetylglucosamine transferase
MELTPVKQNRFEIEKLEDRIAPAVAVGAGGLVAIAAAIDRIDVDIPVEVKNNTICVNVAAIDSRAAC